MVGAMDVFGTVVNVALVAATLVVIWYAREAVKESGKATTAAQKTVSAVEALLTAARDTAASSADSVLAARETVEIARSAREADERYRQLQQLREVGRLVQAVWVNARYALDVEPLHARPHVAVP